MLIITEYIKKHELVPVARYFTIQDIKKSVNKVASSGIEMSNLGYKNCKIVKVRIGSKPAGRMIIYIQIEKNYFIPILIRLKKDKILGENLALSNKKAEQKIIHNLEMIFEDLQRGRYEKFELRK